MPCPCMLPPTWFCIEMEDVLYFSRQDITLSSAAVAALEGMATEAKRLVDLLSQKDTDVLPEYCRCNKIRVCTATVLVKLEQESACKATAAAANTTSERVTDVSDSMGGSSNKDMNNSKVEIEL